MATFGAYFGFVANQGGAYRLVFESDLSNEPMVRERLDRSVQECAEMISEVIADDTSIPQEAAHLLGVGLVGTAQVSARYWLRTGQRMPQGGRAVAAVGAHRGVGGGTRHAEEGDRRVQLAEVGAGLEA